MAELNSNEEPHVLPSKRKQIAPDADAESTKKQQVDTSADNSASACAAVEDKTLIENGDEEEDEEEDYDGEDEVDSEDEEEDDDDDEDEIEHSNGKAEVDRKGKGIMKDDKGKGKLIEESEDDDSSDDDDDDAGGSESDGDDDLSDDPLAEVDLDNILPSRTRRRTAPPGVRISNDKDNHA